ncbi:periplasmic heavy metal sensor [Parasphingorhabdus sp.]|uniref:periplasmic heavy metal sensor n=1 Tax=Parasphingorhabdus sp. TaxID=2709688 RepID=UPI003D2D8D94
MKIGPARIALLILLALGAGFLGSLAANKWSAQSGESQSLHSFVHHELNLSDSQSKDLEVMEDRFAVKRRSLELSLRAANGKLATAMDEEHEFGPKVASAIKEVHERMGELQKATVAHVFEMRAILTPDQQIAFDQRVGDALTTDLQ